MTNPPSTFGPEFIEALLKNTPRNARGDMVCNLMGIHRAVLAWMDTVRISDDDADTLGTVRWPVERLLGQYRPTTLHGLATMLEFILANVEKPDVDADFFHPWLRAAIDGANGLASVDDSRKAAHGTPVLQLCSPIVGDPHQPSPAMREANR